MTTKKKEQKKKDRERRVAQKKLAATEKRLAQEKAADEKQQSVPKTKRPTVFNTQQKPSYVATNSKKPFTHRRSGGG